MSNDTLNEGQLRYKREREQEAIDYQRSLYERAISRQEREKEALKPKVFVDQKAEAMRVHQAGVDKQKAAQVAAQVAAKENAESSAKYFTELQQKQAAPKPEEERSVCPTCGEPVQPGLAFHRRKAYRAV